MGELARAGVHAYGQTILGGFAGNQPSWSGFAIGLASSLTGSATSFLPSWTQIGTSALTGGITAELTGGNFWEGAATGATIGLLNHVWHQSTRNPNDYDGFDPMYFENIDDAYEYMWTTSNSAQVELSAWILEDGTVKVMPYHKNTIDQSYNVSSRRYDHRTGKYYRYTYDINGERVRITGQIHTHILDSDNPKNPIGISRHDLDLIRGAGFPIQIIYNSIIYSVDGTYNQRQKMYNFKPIKSLY